MTYIIHLDVSFGNSRRRGGRAGRRRGAAEPQTKAQLGYKPISLSLSLSLYIYIYII